MISSPSLRIYAADEQGSSSNDGGSKGDSGGGNKDDGGGKEDSKESNDGGGNEKSNSQSKDVEDSGTQQEDKQETGAQETKNPDDLKGTPEEQEKAAVEDYINEEPGIKKPYPPVTDKPKWGTGTGIHTNPWKGEGGNWCKQHPDKCDHPIHDGCDHGNWHHGCGGGKGGHGGSGHGGHNDWCSHHDCHHHHHSNTHFSDNHNGDVTVKVHVTDYKSNDLSDVHLIIGDVYEKNLDLNSEPDTIKVDNLDIDGGDDFAVCLANEDSNEGDCKVAHADSDHDEVNVNLKVL